MKPTYLIGVSAIAAAILFSGCGSSDSSGTVPISAPDEIKQAIDINQTSIQNVMAYLHYNLSGLAAPKKISNPGTGTNTGTNTYDCGLSGTWTENYDHTYENEADGSYTYKDSWSAVYNNCIESSNNAYTSFTATRYTRNGTRSGYNSISYDANTSSNLYTYGGEDNFTAVYDNNETDVGLSSYIETNTFIIALSQDTLTQTMAENINGGYSALDRNETGDIVGGGETIWDRVTYTRTAMPEHEQTNINGSYTSYTYYSDGTKHLNSAEYFVNFAFATDGLDDHNMTVSGTVGTLCLGGSVTFATNPIIREDQMSYMDENNNTGSNVLPYSGTLTVTGTSTATVAFDNNTTHSEAVVHIGGTSQTYGGWNTLATGPCD